MKHLIIAAGLCLGAAACSAPGQAAVVLPSAPVTAAPHVTPVWWGGPDTVCRRGYYGGVWCRPARPLMWVPGHYDWRGFWVPGHWA